MTTSTVHPEKLEWSKWTALAPVDGEKHFLVVQVFRNRHGHVLDVLLESVLSRRRQRLPWRELRDGGTWTPGWC